MKIDFSKPFWQVLGIGSLAGIRASFGPLLASEILNSNHSTNLESSPLNFIQTGKAVNTLRVMAIGELIADKLPTTGDRISTGGVCGRMVSGGLAGASIYKAASEKTARGTILGAAAALAATYASFYLRKGIVEKSKIFDPVIGVLEDAVAICAGIYIVKHALEVKSHTTTA